MPAPRQASRNAARAIGCDVVERAEPQARHRAGVLDHPGRLIDAAM